MTKISDPRQRLVTVGVRDDGLRVDRVLAEAVPELSRSRLKRLITAGCVSLDGKIIDEPDYRVSTGQDFVIIIPYESPSRLEAQPIPLDVVYEDQDLIVINKPAGMVVHPAPGNPDRTLANALIAHCGDSLKGVGGVQRPGIVHRLDKDTSGLMVAAKNDNAHQSLVAQFAGRQIERGYLALIWGCLRPPSGEISGNIGRSPRNRKKMAVLRHGGRPALTRYRSLHQYAGGAASLVECRLATGRTHQIRVHLSERGHPVIGDPLYGGGATKTRLAALPNESQAKLARFARQALHAYILGFTHPRDQRSCQFRCNLPPDILCLTRSLEIM